MPATYTPSQAKNFIKRSLQAVLDRPPSLTERRRLWAHFDSRCAYCDTLVPFDDRGSHLDHLVSGATNHISNRVPSCAQCNEVEKRDKPWKPFLHTKCLTGSEFERREARILAWVAASSAAGQASQNPAAAAEAEIAAVIATYDAALERIRALRISGDGV